MNMLKVERLKMKIMQSTAWGVWAHKSRAERELRAIIIASCNAQQAQHIKTLSSSSSSSTLNDKRT